MDGQAEIMSIICVYVFHSVDVKETPKIMNSFSAARFLIHHKKRNETFYGRIDYFYVFIYLFFTFYLYIVAYIPVARQRH
jgi:hypothetical protein